MRDDAKAGLSFVKTNGITLESGRGPVPSLALVGGKATYVHRRLWPALVRLAGQFDAHRLTAIREVHTATGKHKIEVAVFPVWVPSRVIRAAAHLAVRQAGEMLRIDESRIYPQVAGEHRQ